MFILAHNTSIEFNLGSMLTLVQVVYYYSFKVEEPG